MRKIYTSIIVVFLSTFLITGNLWAQRTCVAHEHMLEQYNKYPKMKEKAAELEQYTTRFLKNYASLKAGEIRTIPVNVIVVYSNSQENISQAQIESQISVLNEDYAGTNSDISGVPSEFTGVTSASSGIQFVLSNIERHSDSRTSWGTNDAVKYAYPPTSPSTTLNMWICNIGGGILGYAQFPGGPAETDGVVFSPQYCGSSDYDDGSFYLSAPFDKGRTATHEIGHYLNLRHIWGDGGCSVDDYVDDTPIAGAANYGCPSYPSKSCSSNGGWSSDMFMNYMDYTDDACMFMFSQGQEARMWACLNSSRTDLGIPGGNIPPTANANGPYTSDPGVAVSFSSAGSSDSDGSIVSYNWNFGDGNTSTQANPSHTYATAGGYTVTLTVTDNKGATGTDNTSATIGDFCPGVEACDGNIQLTLITDKYASETSWTLKDGIGTTIESGSGYANSTTYNINWNLAQDQYTFTINDSYGDGICCGYGNGSYTIIDGCTNTIITGGNFGSSETTEFCVPGGGPVNQPPVAEANGPYSGETGVTVSFSSAGSTDSDGTIVSYLWDFGDGNTSTSANPNHTYTTEGNYTVSLTVADDDGATGTDNAAATITTGGTGETVVLEESYFETGWDGWIDGGRDVGRYNGSRSYEGNYSIAIRDNSGVNSRMISAAHDITSYDQIEIDFYFYAYSMESGEDFWVILYDGTNWNTVAAYVSGTHFDNGNFYHATVVVNASDYNFTSGSRFAFQCDASNNQDLIYIDQVTVTASSGTAKVAGFEKVTGVSNLKIADALNEGLKVFPNPVNDVLTIEFEVIENTKAEIYNLNGALIKSTELFKDKSSIPVGDLKSGVYILKVSNAEEVVRQRFIKK